MVWPRVSGEVSWVADDVAVGFKWVSDGVAMGLSAFRMGHRGFTVVEVLWVFFGLQWASTLLLKFIF